MTYCPETQTNMWMSCSAVIHDWFSLHRHISTCDCPPLLSCMTGSVCIHISTCHCPALLSCMTGSDCTKTNQQVIVLLSRHAWQVQSKQRHTSTWDCSAFLSGMTGSVCTNMWLLCSPVMHDWFSLNKDIHQYVTVLLSHHAWLIQSKQRHRSTCNCPALPSSNGTGQLTLLNNHTSVWTKTELLEAYNENNSFALK